MENEISKKSSAVKALVLSFVVLLGLIFVGAGIFGYVGARQLSQSKAVVFLADIFDIPVAKVNGETVKYSDYVRDVNVISLYNASAEGGSQLTEQDISDTVLDRLVGNALLTQQAKKLDVVISPADVDAELETLFAQAPSRAEAEQQFKDKFDKLGWTIDDYKNQVLYFVILQRKLIEVVSAQPINEGDSDVTEEVHARHILLLTSAGTATSTVKANAQKVLDRIKAGEDFVTLAKEFSQDPGSADNGGDLGWFAKGAMVPEFEASAFALEAGQVSPELVQTTYGFHIIKTEEKRQAKDFNSFISNIYNSAKIEVTIPKINNPFANSLVTQ